MIIKENSIIICNQNTKTRILEENFSKKKLFNATFLSLEEFRNKFYFEITDEAYVFAAKFLDTSYDNAKVIVPNIYYIDVNEEYSDEKLINLQTLKKVLIENKLLKFDSLFKEFIKEKEIYIIELFLDKFYTEMFKNIDNDVFYENNPKVTKGHQVSIFDNYVEEVEYVFSEIYLLLDKGININNIYVVCESDEYTHLINRYSRLYDIDVCIKEKESIKNHKIVKQAFLLLKAGLTREKVIEELTNSKDIYIVNQLIKLFNRFYFINNNEELIRVLESEINNVYYEDKKVIDAVRVVSLNNYFKKEDYVYFLGFNNNSIPKMHIDDDYLSDKYEAILPITSSVEKNKLERNKAIYLISNIENLYVSYSKFTQSENLISPLFDQLDCLKKNKKASNGISKKVDTLKLGTMIDDLVNFNIHNEFLDILYSSIGPIYKTYSNKFSTIDKELLRKKLNGFISLSYSSISTYYKCQFSYYLERVLKIRHNTDKSAAQIGTMFHAILEKYGTLGFDLEKEKNLQLESTEDKSVKFYFEKLWPDFKVVFEIIDSFKEQTYLNDELHEQEFSIDYSDDLYQMFFTGKADKIIYTNIDGVDYVSIIDYKTGSYDVATFNNVEHGFNLQLPVYAYFLAKSTMFKNPKILGLFLQKVLNDCKPTKTKDLHSVQLEALKLQGYSTVNRSELSILDPTFKSSKYIKSMSVTKDDVFGRYAKVYSDSDLLKIIETVEDLILTAFDNIRDGEFTINPKEINGTNQSCMYCPYSNICYKGNQDTNVLEEKKFTETIEGGE